MYNYRLFVFHMPDSPLNCFYHAQPKDAAHTGSKLCQIKKNLGVTAFFNIYSSRPPIIPADRKIAYIKYINVKGLKYMDWTDIVLSISSKDITEASSIAQMAVPRGLYIEDYSTFDEDIKFFGPVEIIDEELIAKDRNIAKIHVYISPEENPCEAAAFLRERLDSAGISYVLDTDNVREEDWANNWKQFFKPMNIGKSSVLYLHGIQKAI